MQSTSEENMVIIVIIPLQQLGQWHYIYRLILATKI